LESPSLLSFFTDYFSVQLLAINPQSTTFMAITLVILLVLSFTISGAEVALFSLTKRDVDMLKTKQHAAARRIINLLDEPKEVYASLLIAGTVINISIIILANFLIENNVPFGTLKSGTINSTLLYVIELVLRTILIGLLLIFVGKIFPKVWAAQNNLRFSYGAAYVVDGLHLLLRRISGWLVSLADNIGKRAGADKSQALSRQELNEAIDIKSDDETSPEEKNIMKGIVKFGDISVKQIMKSRLDVSGLEYTLSFDALLKRAEELHYSRLPVYKESLDTVIGIVNTKDLIPHLHEPTDFDWHQLIRTPYFVPEAKPIEDLLKEFQHKRIHFAIVVDEFGGTSGIVTMEDILEEVIGDIRDEFDEEESSSKKLDESNYIFDGKVMIHDACKTMKLPLYTFDKVKGESDSLAGLILELAGEFPEVDEVVSSGDFDFTVLQANNNRIQQVKVTIKPRA
jgi:putative hemolysin